MDLLSEHQGAPLSFGLSFHIYSEEGRTGQPQEVSEPGRVLSTHRQRVTSHGFCLACTVFLLSFLFRAQH